MNYDIYIIAFIAVLVLARLWSVFGQKNGEERERENPFADAPEDKDPAPPSWAQAGEEPPLPPKPLMLPPASLAGGLARIKEADPVFDEKAFIQSARSMFVQILGDFVKGDVTASASLLAPAVYQGFNDAIAERRNAGHSLEHELVTLRDAECIRAACADDGNATITVRFVSLQRSTVRDASGKCIGPEGAVEEVTDIWTFSRNAKDAASSWILSGTRA